ncbi:hypothetical protein ANANG_G00086960 [Anguilla anguilla]|uniref:Uncharacterized protein n=1 Tax=Anguilla anguilla TaxID=7936 RepID=A0A9D3MQR1_ANGAN|nr:hypothetical protein ANANG_G00086960 [Anguilla anguilla]
MRVTGVGAGSGSFRPALGASERLLHAWGCWRGLCRDEVGASRATRRLQIRNVCFSFSRTSHGSVGRASLGTGLAVAPERRAGPLSNRSGSRVRTQRGGLPAGCRRGWAARPTPRRRTGGPWEAPRAARASRRCPLATRAAGASAQAGSMALRPLRRRGQSGRKLSFKEREGGSERSPGSQRRPDSVEHCLLDPSYAVRRRFSGSIHLPPLSRRHSVQDGRKVLDLEALSKLARCRLAARSLDKITDAHPEAR